MKSSMNGTIKSKKTTSKSRSRSASPSSRSTKTASSKTTTTQKRKTKETAKRSMSDSKQPLSSSATTVAALAAAVVGEEEAEMLKLSKRHREEEDAKKNDTYSILLLLLLYFLQGIPFGLSGTLDLTMQEGGRLSFEEQGIYSSVSWPYSLKMLWAPIVDSLFLHKFGRRKTWLVPTQLLIALMLLFSADYIPGLLGEGTGEKPQVLQLTLLFFTFFFLCATQDIAVDGWALEMLSKKNVGWASTCNSIGLTAGYTVSFQGFMALRSFGLCDFTQFMKISGWCFLLTTLLVAVFKKEDLLEEAPSSIKLAYVQSWQVIKLPAVKLLLFALLTRSVAFAAADTLTTRKLLAIGMKKEMIATIAALLMPISLILPGLLSKYTNDKPLAVFVKGYIPRIALAICSAALVYVCPRDLATTDAPAWFWAVVFVLSVFASIITTSQFVALMAFFAKVSDPLVGGSYMTTLNTATNLGSKWPNTIVLFAVNPLTWRSCESAGDGPVKCETIVDGYYILMALCLVLGVVWIRYFAKRLGDLEALGEDVWRVPRKLERYDV